MEKLVEDKNDLPVDVKKAVVTEAATTGSRIGENVEISSGEEESVRSEAGAVPQMKKEALSIANGGPEREYMDSKRRTEVKTSKDEDAENEQRPKLEKKHFETLIESMRKLVRILREREDGRLDPILPEDGAGRIMRSANAIEGLFENKEMDFEELNREIMKISTILDANGARHRGGVREDIENLQRLKFALSGVEEGCHDVIIKTVKDGSPEIKMTMTSIGKLFNSVQAKKLNVARSIEVFDGYHRR